MSIMVLRFLVGIVFLTIVFLHLVKKNYGAVLAYNMQSLAIVVILFNSFLETGRISLLFITLLAFVVKVVLAPLFFVRMIKKNGLRFSVSTYLNTPLTLIVIAAITAIAHSSKLAPLADIVPANHALLSLALSAMLLSLVLIINRKGALSQIIGILSFENSIIVFAVFAGLEQSPSLQAGILFDLFVWIVIATVFMSMIYRHFGSLDVTSMRHLKD